MNEFIQRVEKAPSTGADVKGEMTKEILREIAENQEGYVTPKQYVVLRKSIAARHSRKMGVSAQVLLTQGLIGRTRPRGIGFIYSVTSAGQALIPTKQQTDEVTV